MPSSWADFERFLMDLLHIQKLVGLIVYQRIIGFAHRGLDLAGPPAHRLAEQIANVEHADIGARHARQFELRHARGRVRHLDLDVLVVKLPVAQFLAEGIAGAGRSGAADQGIEHAFFGIEPCLGLHFATLAVTNQRDADLDQVADDLFDIAADIADLGELRRLDLDEGRARQPRQTARDLGLADAGRPDHQDVLGHHLLAQQAFQLLSPPAVPQRNRNSALGVVLADDEPVKFGDRFAGGEIAHVGIMPLSGEACSTAMWEEAGG